MRWRSNDDPFAGFTDVQEIGTGAFATVYRATDATSGQPVALKVLHAADAGRVDDDVLQLEARALGAVSTHPNIVTLYRAVLRGDGSPMLVLERCEGSFADRLATTGPVPVREAVAVAIKLAGALETAHRAGVLHRDLKPSNVLTTVYGEPVLADFGIAGLRGTGSGRSPRSGLTLHHAAPELLLGEDAVPASDVYGLASVLYELLDGHPPFFVTRDEEPATVQRRILADPPPRLAAADVPPALRDLVRRAMAKDPATRPSTALELAQELRDVEHSRGWGPTPCRIDGAQDLPTAARSARPNRDRAAATTGLPGLGLGARPLEEVDLHERQLAPRRDPGPSFLPARDAPLLAARGTQDPDAAQAWAPPDPSDAPVPLPPPGEVSSVRGRPDAAPPGTAPQAAPDRPARDRRGAASDERDEGAGPR